MNLAGLLLALGNTSTFSDLLEELRARHQSLEEPITRSARPYLISTLAQNLQTPILVLCGRTNRAHDIAEQIPAWLPNARVLRLLEPGPMFYDHAPWTDNTIRARIQVLEALAPPLVARHVPDTYPPIIVASVHALMQYTLPVYEFRKAARQLKVGQVQDPDKLLHHLVAIGYEPATVVTQPGTFSRRGGIIDVYPPAMADPVRIEFFGDEIDSLRTFGVGTQRSIDTIKSFILTPAREVLPQHTPRLAERLESWFANQPPIQENVDSLIDDLTHLVAGSAFPHLEFYLSLIYDTPTTLLDYLPDETLLVVDDWQTVNDIMTELETQALEVRHDRESRDLLPPNMPLPYLTWDELHDAFETRHPLHLGTSDAPSTLGFAPEKRFGGQLRMFLDHIQELPADEPAVIVTRQAQRLAELWRERSVIQLHPMENIETLDDLSAITFVEGELAEGWALNAPDQRVHLFTDAEIFGWQRPEPRRRKQKRAINP